MFEYCSGPFKVNGVPLRRVNQAYVIATSTKVDISSVDVAKFSDSYFKREVAKKTKGESEFFEAEKAVSIHYHHCASEQNIHHHSYRFRLEQHD